MLSIIIKVRNYLINKFILHDDMSNMFMGSNFNLDNLNIRAWKIDNVTDMSPMFDNVKEIPDGLLNLMLVDEKEDMNKRK